MVDNVSPSLPSSCRLITSILSELASYNPRKAPGTGAFATPSKHEASIATDALQPADNRLAKLSEEELSEVKPLLLTTHCIFPNEFLLALDIIDRKLVRKLVVTENGGLKKVDEIYFVRSISSPSSSSSPSSVWRQRRWQRQNQEQLGNAVAQSGHNFHEVRLKAWNCSCPAFTLASFQDNLRSRDKDDGGLEVPHVNDDHHITDGEWMFGDGDGGCTSEGRRRIIEQLEDATGDEGTEKSGEKPAVVCKHLLACVLGSKCPGLFDGGIEQATVSIKEAAGWCASW